MQFTPEMKVEYCRLFSVNAAITESALGVGVVPQTVRNHMKKDEVFAEAVADALQAYRDSLKTELVRRARNGVLKNIYHNGIVVGCEIQYSDAMLMAAVKATDPSFRDKATVDVNVVPMPFYVMPPRETEEEWVKRTQRLVIDGNGNGTNGR